MKDLRASARGALGKGASLRRFLALELLAHGGPSGHRPFPRLLNWEGALRRGRGRGPIRSLKQTANRLQRTPAQTGWRQGDQYSSWDEADYKVNWDSALQLSKEVTAIRLDFQGLDSGLSTQALRQLKLDGQSQKDTVRIALNAALGGVWHEARANVFDVGDWCVRCGEAVEDLEHIVHQCPAWAAESLSKA
eukprot:5028104-Amphidinium_carterae.1